ncbi:MAG: hypothetical protein QW587_10425 [Candidatus Bathyarchaeia archaeon]
MLFGALMPYIGEALGKLGFSTSQYYVEGFSGGFPDCTLVLDRQKVRVEFELYSGNFKDHGHDPEKCDIIICWKHDWYGCPENVKVLTLHTLVSKLASEGDQRIVVNSGPKPGEEARWSIEELMDRLRTDYPELKAFIEKISAMERVELRTGNGALLIRMPTPASKAI